MHKIKFQIGDWSGDGHGKHDDFLFESNRSAKELREIYFSTVEKTGFDIAGICSEYEDTYLRENDADKMCRLGYVFDKKQLEEIAASGGTEVSGSEEYMNMLIWFLKLGDPELSLVQIVDNYENFHFYGYDDRDRHINFMGYGLFY